MEAITCAGYYAIVIVAIETPTSGNSFHLFIRQFLTGFFHECEKFFRGFGSFNLFFCSSVRVLRML